MKHVSTRTKVEKTIQFPGLYKPLFPAGPREIHIRKLEGGWGVNVIGVGAGVYAFSTFEEVIVFLKKSWPQKRGKA